MGDGFGIKIQNGLKNQQEFIMQECITDKRNPVDRTPQGEHLCIFFVKEMDYISSMSLGDIACLIGSRQDFT